MAEEIRIVIRDEGGPGRPPAELLSARLSVDPVGPAGGTRGGGGRAADGRAEESRRLDEERRERRREEEERSERGLRERIAPAAGAAVGGTVGRYAGAAVGAAVGGPVGAAVGGAVGGVVGSAVGSRVVGRENDEAPADVTRGTPLERIQSVADQTEKALKLVGGAARFASEGFQRVAGGDGIGAFMHATEGAASVLEGIPVVGKAAAESLRTFNAVVGGANAVLGAFAARGRELRGFDPRIAGAAAAQDVTRTLTDIREAQRLGERYAATIQAQTQFNETLKAGLIPLKDWIMSWLPKMMDMILDVLMKSLECLDKMVPGTTVAGDMLVEMKAMRRALTAGGPGAGDIFRAWLDAPMVGPDFPALPAAPAAPLGIPLIPAP